MSNMSFICSPSCICDEAGCANDSDVKTQGQSQNAWAAMLVADVVLYISHNASGRLQQLLQRLQGQDSYLIPYTCCEVE